LQNAQLVKVNRQGLTFKKANLIKTAFCDADLQNANLEFANLNEANFQAANLKG
jgi:uncharacterized protein YjbI with pentapeptide repeats